VYYYQALDLKFDEVVSYFNGGLGGAAHQRSKEVSAFNNKTLFLYELFIKPDVNTSDVPARTLLRSLWLKR